MRRGDYSLGGFVRSVLDGGGKGGGEKKKREKVTVAARGERLKPSTRAISIGVSDGGRVVNLPLFENRIAIVGASGSGKSVVANEVLAGVFSIPAKYRVVALVDLKGGVEIGAWLPAADAYAVDSRYANLIVRNVEREMLRRQRVLFGGGGKKVKISENMPLLVLFIDELAEIADSKDELDKDTMNRLRSIFRLGRATGIVPVVCLQRPDSKLLSGDLKNNISTTICGYLRSEVDTRTVFGTPDEFPAHELKGHWFYLVGEKAKAKFKTPYRENKRGMTDEWERVIERAGKEKPPDRGKFLYRDESRKAEPGRKKKRGGSAAKKKKPGVDFPDGFGF